MSKKKVRLIVLLVLAGLLLLVAMFGKYLAPMDPLAVDYQASLQAPSLTHLWGTDKLGRDILSRILWGGQSSFSVTFLMVMIVVVIGTGIGILAGYLGKFSDTLIMRLTDVLLAFPSSVFAIAVAGSLGVGLFNTIIALGLVWWTKYARMTRSMVPMLKNKEYVIMARLGGAKGFKIIYKYILPNILPQIIVTATLDIGGMLMALAGLSFLGLASQPPLPEWGTMLYESRQYMQVAPWMMIFPGLTILVTVIVFNLLGDALRDYLDIKETGD